MKIDIQRDEDSLKLIRDMGSEKKSVSEAAQEAFAEFIGPVIKEVINNASTTAGLFKDVPFGSDGDYSIPLDTYYGEDAGQFTIWSQPTAGGLPTNFTGDVAELKVATYTLNTAISMLKKYAEKSRLDVVSKAMTRMAQLLMIKQDRNAYAVILKALANARTGTGTTNQHVFRTDTAGQLSLVDFNNLLVRARRINASFAGGTPDSLGGLGNGITDLYMSPEVFAEIRALAYQPVNTRPGSFTSNGATAIAAPESLREAAFRNAGVMELYNISLHQLNELGLGQKYNELFGLFAGATTYTEADGSTGSAAFAQATTQIIVGVDSSRESLLRPVRVDDESGGDVIVRPDDQWTARSEKLGFYAKVEEGRVIADDRSLVGLIF